MSGKELPSGMPRPKRVLICALQMAQPPRKERAMPRRVYRSSAADSKRTFASVPASGPRKTASDVKAAWVEFRPLIADDKAGTKPTARIFVDGLRDESGFNATMLARYELQQLVEKYLPEVEIDGPRFIEERYLAVKNGTDETLTVWIQAESLVREGRGETVDMAARQAGRRGDRYDRPQAGRAEARATP